MLDRSEYFIKEHVAMFKLTDTYDILDPRTEQPIGIAKEEPPSWLKYMRLIVNKQLLPTTINIYENENQPPVFSIHKPFALFAPKVFVHDGTGQQIGYFQGKVLSLKLGFWVYDAQGNQVAELQGDWKGWDFKFVNKEGRELGQVNKKWAGLTKELLTSADNYMVTLSEQVKDSKEMSALLLAAALSVDIIFKEAG